MPQTAQWGTLQEIYIYLDGNGQKDCLMAKYGYVGMPKCWDSKDARLEIEQIAAATLTKKETCISARPACFALKSRGLQPGGQSG